jgi:hypothetical protein
MYFKHVRQLHTFTNSNCETFTPLSELFLRMPIDMGFYAINFLELVVLALVEFVELRTLIPLFAELYLSFLGAAIGVLQIRVLEFSWSMPEPALMLSILGTCLLTY